jgi:zinc transport system substrate-binding protein
LIYVGGESERWVEDAIRSTRNDERRTLRLMDIVGVCDEDLHGGDHKDHDHSEADEHVWLSLKYAAQICRKIAYEITIIDSESSELYLSLCDGYISELMKLDESYSIAVNEGVRDTLIFVDRFPFVYLLADYGIKHYAAFEGCSSDSDISFEAVIELAKRVDEVGAGYVLIIDGNDGKMANTVISNTKDKSCRVLALDSMQSVSLAEMNSEYSYLSVMRENLEVIRLALS